MKIISRPVLPFVKPTFAQRADLLQQSQLRVQRTSTLPSGHVYFGAKTGLSDQQSVLSALPQDNDSCGRDFLTRYRLKTVGDVRVALQHMTPKNVKDWNNVANGLRHIHSQYWPLAEEIYQAMLKHPHLSNSAKAHACLGLAKIVHRQYGQEDVVFQWIKTALDYDPQNPYLHIWYADWIPTTSISIQDTSQAILYRQALQSPEAENDPRLKIKALLGLGNIRDGDQETHYREALFLARKVGDKKLLAQILIGLGYTGEKNRISYYHEAQALAQEIGDKKIQAQAFIGLGNTRCGDSKVYYQKALVLAREIGHYELQAKALIGLGNTLEGDDAAHYREALDLAKKSGSARLQAQALIGLGNAREGDRVSHYQNALEIAKRIQDNRLVAQALIGLGNVASSQADNEAALTYFKDALQLASHRSLQEQARRGIERVQGFLARDSA